MWHLKRIPSRIYLVIPILSILLLAVACGESAAPQVDDKEVAGEAVKEVVVEQETVEDVPKDVAVEKEGVKEAVVVATPSPVAEPAEVVVNPGKVTLMLADWGNERFDGAFASGDTESYLRMLGGYLTSDSEERRMIPGVATKWEISPDGLIWKYTIREGVKFHDGSELTAEDVVWNLQHLYGPEAAEYNIGPGGSRMAKLTEKIELTGPNEVSMSTAKFITELGVYLSETSGHRYHIMPKRDALHDTEVELAYDDNPIGAGPMRLVKKTPATSMTFERFDDFYFQPANGFYQDRRMKFQSLELVLAPEEATRIAALQAGETDIAPVSPESKKQAEAGGGRLIYAREAVYLEGRMYGCFDPQFTCHDKRFRQALNYALNKEVIQNQLYGGPEVWQLKGWDAITPSSIGYTTGLDPWPFDPDKARQLLADAGYPGGEGADKVVLNVAVSGVLPFMIEGAQLAADAWRRELGLDVEVKVGDRSGLRKEQRAGQLNGQIWWRENDARVDAGNIIAGRYNDPGGSSNYHDQEWLFELVDSALGIVDPDERAQAIAEMLPRVREESYQVTIGYGNTTWALGPRILTWEPRPLALFPTALYTITLE